MRRRFGRPGLIGTMARTAVIAGTATAVAGSVSGHRQARAQQATAASQQAADAQQAAIEQEVAGQLAARQAASAAPAPADPLAQLERLAEMKQQGLLSDDEFTAMKAKLLGT